MAEMSSNDISRVNGGVVPLVILAAKGFGAGFGAGAAAFTLYFTIHNQN
jgi:lactobin A/cerein 7B family class IIb bacteriocin